MSSPIFGSLPSSGATATDARHRSSSFSAPRLDLVLRPSLGLGPFKLGHSLWHVLNYLRSQQSLFPHINIVYDETAPRLSPIVVTIQPSLHLIFHATTQRLILITLENLDAAASTGSRNGSPSAPPPASPSGEPSHRLVNLFYNGKLIYASGTARSQHVVLNRSTLHQILGPTYPGRSESSHVASESLVALAHGRKDAQHLQSRTEFLLTYPGLAFCFTLKSDAPKAAEVDKLQPVSSIHVFSGSDPDNPLDVLVAPSPDQGSSDAGAPGRLHKPGTLSPTAALADYAQLNNERDRAALDVEAIYVGAPVLLQADVTPGKSVALHFAKTGASRTASPLPGGGGTGAAATEAPVGNVVELMLGVTTPQDALCDLGQPQRIFYKEDDRMRIHGGSTHAGADGQTRGAAAGAREGSENSTATDESLAASHELDDSAFFYNYFDLGIDLLFSKQTMRMPSGAEVYGAAALGQARLEKVVCHTNVPGDALFQRYNRCPWRVVRDVAKKTANTKSEAAFSFEDHFDSTLSKGQDDRGMELDRGTSAELRGSGATQRRSVPTLHAKTSALDGSPERDGATGELLIDLSTRLVGRDGMVIEVAKDGSMVGVVVF
ncbi:alkyl hydroperoxide reductase [Moesziomyces antarcticus T-34]|uniref:Alkyl hydroperoxide reductase n=1 Tax=Pseudozyma antarctica (strain T-34) TaxID=1151754 RepID=M9LYW9_PSEA3|nr:alkyl hydroperoxide reductase [Moesziomyces antarcticus T-34]